MDHLLPFLAACQAAVAGNQGLLGSLAMAGLVGGFGHCAGMCGPFVLAQTTARLAATPADRMDRLTRLRGALLAPYHLGRLITYTGLGAAAGTITAGMGRSFGLHWLSAALLGLAGLFFLAYGLSRFGLRLPRISGGPAWLGPSLARVVRPLLGQPRGWRGFALGLALGFLPCGMLYGAIAAAAAAGSPLGGMLAMATFAVTTVPGLLAVGLAGHLAAGRWRPLMARLGAGLMVVNGGLLAWLAWSVAA